MFFTPFAFIQQPYAVVVVPSILQGYYIGGTFTTYATNTNPYFRMLTSDGFISSSFNIGAGFTSLVRTAATQSDGKIVVGGDFTQYSGSNKFSIVRLNTNGTADTGSSWNQGAGFNSTVNTVAIQADQKIIAGGNFTSYSGSSRGRIARINTDGTADPTSSFNIGSTGFIGSISAVAIQADQKIIAGGNFTSYSGSTKNHIVRINTDGTADTGSSWNQGAGLNSQINTVAVQTDQKVVAGGTFTSYSGSTKNRIVRINTDGTADTGSSWNQGAGFDGIVATLAIQSDQKIVVGGGFTSYSGSTVNRIARLNTDGTRDPASSFDIGAGFNASVSSLAIQSDGKILAKGFFTAYSGSVANGLIRINSNGTLDNTFNRNLSINNSINPSIILPLSNGSIIVGGFFTGDKIGYMTFLSPTGSTNATSSMASYGFDGSIISLAVQADGKALAAGSFTTYSGSTVNRIVRLNTDGTADTGSSWNTGAGFNSSTQTVVVQSDQKILVGGNFSLYSGSTKNAIVRLNTNGTADTGSSWNQGTGFSGGIVNSIAIQADQKIVAGGGFTTYSGSGKNYIARLNIDGTADTGSSFNIGVGFNTQVLSIAIQADQKIVAGGNFISYSGSTANRITRINTNGTVDTTFNTGVGFDINNVGSVAVQADGKVLAVGSFTAYSGSSKNRIVRINTDGTADTTTSFNIGTGFNNTVSFVTVQSDQKILVGGFFLTYSGSTANRIVRINPNGTRDTTFVPTGTGFNNNVNTILPISY